MIIMPTNFAKASYKEVYDICTRPDQPTIIAVHTPVSNRPVSLLQGFWTQFKKFKYDGCKIAMVPASTLPADPLQIGFQAGKSISPKDMLNPILAKGYIGESLGWFLDAALAGTVTGYERRPQSSIEMDYGNSADVAARFSKWYYQNLITKGWRKSSVQSGLSMSGLRPRVWALGVNKPLQTPILTSAGLSGQLNPRTTGVGLYTPSMSSNEDTAYFEGANSQYNPTVQTGNIVKDEPSLSPGADTFVRPVGVNFMTYKSVPLGWQDTVVNVLRPQVQNSSGVNLLVDIHNVVNTAVYSTLDKHYCAVIVLPPSENTVFYWRMVVTHYYKFKGFRYQYIESAGYNQPFGVLGGANQLDIPLYNEIGYNRDESVAKATYKLADGHDVEVAESGTLDVINGTPEFVSDTLN